VLVWWLKQSPSPTAARFVDTSQDIPIPVILVTRRCMVGRLTTYAIHPVLLVRTMPVRRRALTGQSVLASRPLLRESPCATCEFQLWNAAPNLIGVGQTNRHPTNQRLCRKAHMKPKKRTNPMKTLIAATALVLTAFSASAMVNTSAIQHYAPNADLSTLSEAEVTILLSIIHSGDSESETRSAVKAMLK
jgi:hypothetical protein